MPTTSHDARLTYEDFLLFPDDGLRHEIIDWAHGRAGGSFPLVAHVTADTHDMLETPLVPGWSVALARLFR